MSDEMTFIDKIRAAPDAVRSFALSEEPRISCEEVCISYGIPEDLFSNVTLPLGPLFVREMALRDYPVMIARETGIDMAIAYGIAYEVNRRIFLRFPEYFTDAEALGRQWEAQKAAPVVSLEEAKRKVLEIESWLLEGDEEEETEASSRAVTRLPLLQAVGEYPNIGNQQITRERIRLEGKQDTVRPSLANWVKAYRNELGIGYHEPVVRAKFLFDSENGKKLSSEERERLNVIIRSIEENEPLEIDTDRGEIIFPEMRAVKRAPKSEVRQHIRPTRKVTQNMSQQTSQSTGAASDTGAEHIASAPPRARTAPRVKPAPSFPDLPPEHATNPNVASAPSSNGASVPQASVTPPPAPRRRTSPVAAAPPDLPVSDDVSEAPPAPRESRPAPRESHPTGGTVSFSSGHALPGERQSGRRPRVRYGQSVPSQPPTPSGQAPSSASPADVESGRVVDLRE